MWQHTHTHTHTHGRELALPESLCGVLPVLVVDDCPDNRGLMLDALGECPLLGASALASAGQALKAADGGGAQPCAVLLDLYLPQLDDGYTVLKRYAQWVPVVAMTGLASAGEAGDAVVLGARRVLQKPFRIPTATRCLCDWAIRHLFLRVATGSPFLVDSIACLHDRSPKTVTEWAAALGPRANYLQRQWHQRGHCPKDVLFVHHLLKSLADFYTSPPEDRPALATALRADLRRYVEREQEHGSNLLHR